MSRSNIADEDEFLKENVDSVNEEQSQSKMQK